MRTVLIEASPWNPSTGAIVPVALAGGGEKAYTHKGRNDWRAGVVTVPKFSGRIDFDENGFSGGARPEFGTLEFKPATKASLDAVAGLLWNGASVEVFTGDDAVAAPVWSTLIKGTVSAVNTRGGSLILTIRDRSGELDVPVADSRFAGDGGLEGEEVAAERLKRRSWGACSNVEARPLKSSTLIYEVGDPLKPLQAIDDVKDMGRSASQLTVVTWKGSAAATLSALEAAVAPQGGGVVAPSIACVKWWTQPVGPLTVDLRGEVGTGYVDTAAAIAERILLLRSGLTMTNRAQASGWRPGRAGLHVDTSSETVAQVLDRLLRGSSLAWAANADGTVRLSEFSFGSPVETVSVISAYRSRTFKPTRRRRVGFRRNHRIHDEGEISSALRDDSGAILTAGADWSTNVVGRPDNLAALVGSEGIKNGLVSISAGGALSGAGGGQVTYGGIGGKGLGLLDLLDAGGPYFIGQLPTSKAVAALINANVSIGANGSLAGGGGGQVTFGGLGGGSIGLRDTLTLSDSYFLGELPTARAVAALRNSSLSIGANGALSGGGGGQVTYSGLGGGALGLLANLDAGGPLFVGQLPTSKAVAGLVNANLSIGANGALSGGGGGQVTLGGIGFQGSRFASSGSNLVRNGVAREAGNVEGWAASSGTSSSVPPNAASGELSIGILDGCREGPAIPGNVNGRRFRLRYWILTSNMGPGHVYFTFRDESGALVSTQGKPVHTEGQGWTYVDTIITGNANCSAFYPGWDRSNSDGSAPRFYDLRVEEIIPVDLSIDTLGLLPTLKAVGGLVNANVSIGANGSLAGGGGGQVTFGGLGGGSIGLRDTLTLSDSYFLGELPTTRAVAALRNSGLSIAANGALVGGGGGQVTISGLGYVGALNATRNIGALADLDSVDLANLSRTNGLLPVSRAVSGLINSGISIAANGALSGGGGGQVTISGLGYVGDLDASAGFPMSPHAGGRYKIAGSTVEQVDGAVGWESNVYSKTAFAGTAYIVGRLETVDAFLGLAQNAVGGSYEVMSFSWHRSANGNWYVYQGLSSVNLGTVHNGVTFDATTDFSITYDGAKVRYYANGFLMHTETAGANLSFYAAISLYRVGRRVTRLRFGPYSDRLWNNLANGPANVFALAGSEGIKNGLVSIGANGALSGGGGGQVTLGGIGFQGSRFASSGSNLVRNGVAREAGNVEGWAASSGTSSSVPPNAASGELSIGILDGCREGPAIPGNVNGRRFRLRYWILTSNMGPGNVFFTFRDESSGVVSTQGKPVHTEGQGWTYVDTIITGNANCSAFYPAWDRSNNDGSAPRFYDLRVEEIIPVDLSIDTLGLLPTARAVAALINANVSISANGSLSGAGGGQVTLAGIDSVGVIGRTSRLNSFGRFLDSRAVPPIVAMNLQYKFTGAITYTAVAGSPATATISVAAGSALVGSSPISYNAMSVNVTGTGGQTTRFFLYLTESTNPSSLGGSKTLVATTNGNNVYSNESNVWIGTVNVAFPSSGSGGGSGGGGGGGGIPDEPGAPPGGEIP